MPYYESLHIWKIWIIFDRLSDFLSVFFLDAHALYLYYFVFNIALESNLKNQVFHLSCKIFKVIS